MVILVQTIEQSIKLGSHERKCSIGDKELGGGIRCSNIVFYPTE